MTIDAKADPQTAAAENELVGLSYLCCRGPNRNHTIRVVELITAGDYAGRYRVESEDDGHRWTIECENLARIFGPAPERRCACRPLGKLASVAEAPTAAEASHAESEQPDEPRPPGEPALPEHAATAHADADDAVGGTLADEEDARAEEGHKAQPPTAAPAGVIHHEESRQSSLF
jgi:hypothetical protein